VNRQEPSRKFALLFALYFVEGLPYGFQGTLPAYLREQGVSLTGIGFVGALSLPWMLKPLWAPLVDRFSLPRIGRRKSWILPMQAALALTCLFAAVSPPSESLFVLLALVLLMNLFAATQDIAIDALAIDLLEPHELGRGNALQVVGYKVGMLTGGGVLVWTSTWIGWHGMFIAMAILVAIVLAVTVRAREPSGVESSRMTIGDVLRRAKEMFALPGMGWVVLFVATYKIGEAMITAMFKPFLIDHGYSVQTIGLFVGSYGMAASLSGSLTGGWLATRFKLIHAVAIAGALRAVSMIGEIALAVFGPTDPTVIAVTVVESFFSGMITTAMFAFMMSLVDRRIGATHYAILAAIEVLGKSPAAWLSGPLAERFGFAGLFGIGAALSALFLLLVVPLERSLKRS
jgi:MFS transporter, PAT family, beta-lactamase induction signal transducer AmpG